MATTLKEMEELAQTISADNDGLWLGDWPDDYLGHIAGYIGRLESQLEQLRERQRVAQDGRRDEGEVAHREQPLNGLAVRSETASRDDVLEDAARVCETAYTEWDGTPTGQGKIFAGAIRDLKGMGPRREPQKPAVTEIGARREGRTKLVYNKATRKIDQVRDGEVIGSFDPPEELG